MINPKWKKGFGWSKSQESVWKDCKLKYYYKYVKKWDALPPKERDALWNLGRLQNFSVLKGSIIHDAIREQIMHHKIGRTVNPLSAKNFFLNKANEIRKNPKEHVVEAFNGLPVDEKFDDLIEDGLKQLDIFFKTVWHNYSDLQYLGHEDLETFNIQDIKIWVKLDLLSKGRDGSIIITDWKTGLEDTNDEMQAEVYTLWAKSRFGVPTDKIVTEFVYLKEPNTQHIQHSEEKLKKREYAILSSAGDMLNVRDEKDFPASPSERKCQHCNFATICPEGKKFLRT